MFSLQVRVIRTEAALVPRGARAEAAVVAGSRAAEDAGVAVDTPEAAGVRAGPPAPEGPPKLGWIRHPGGSGSTQARVVVWDLSNRPVGAEFGRHGRPAVG